MSPTNLSPPENNDSVCSKMSFSDRLKFGAEYTFHLCRGSIDASAI